MEKKEEFREFLRQENLRVNLISRRSFDRTFFYLWEISSEILRALEPFSSLVDVGSGGGFPGLAIKLMAPEKRIVLVEPRKKKADFLRRAVERFSLENVEVVEGDFFLFHKIYCHSSFDYLTAMGIKRKESFIREDCQYIKKGYCFVTGESEVKRLLSHGKVKKYNTEVRKISGRDKIFLVIIRKWEKS